MNEALLIEQPRMLLAVAKKDPEVVDSYVAALGDSWVTFVAAPAASSELRARLHTALQQVAPGCALVLLTALPYTPEGVLDLAALEREAVFDDASLAAAEHRIRQQPHLETGTVVLREQPGPAVGVLSGLLPDEPRLDPMPAQGAPAAPAAPARSSALSLSEGGPLPVDPDGVVTLGQALERTARLHSERGVIHVSADRTETFESYAGLLQRAQQFRAGLGAAGVKHGQPIILALEQSIDFLPAFWGALLAGTPAAPVAVPPVFRRDHPAADRMLHAWERLEGPPIIATRATAGGLRAMAAELGLSLRVLVIDELLASQPLAEPSPVQPDDIALFFMTSGSTGKPKLVPQRHRNLLAHGLGSSRARGQSSADVALNWMPLDHVGGCVMHGLTDTFVGSRQIHVVTSVILAEPLLWLDLMHRHRVNFTWAPNFAYALVVERLVDIPASRWDLSCARFFLNGGEAVVPRTAKRFVELLRSFGLPETSMRPAYGMSEICSAITYANSFLPETVADDAQVTDVGPPSPGVRIRIVDSNDQLLPEGVSGALQVKGAVVMSGYYNQPQANQEAFTADGWFRTGDVAQLLQGRLTITGREKEVVVVNGVKYACRDIELVVEELPGVEPSHAAASPVRLAGQDTEQLAIFFSTALQGPALAELLQRIRADVTRRIGLAPSWLLPIEREQIPRTGIGKIERPKLRKRLEQGEFDEINRQVEALLGAGRTLPDWFFTRAWSPRQARLHEVAPGPVLLLADRGGLASAVAAGLDLDRIADPGHLAIDETRLLSLDPNEAPQFLERSLRELVARDGLPKHIVHLLTCDQGAGRAAGAGVLVTLARTLDALRVEGERVKLLVVSRRAQSLPGDPPAALELAELPGLVSSLGDELPWLDARHVDLEHHSHPQQADQVLQELAAAQHDREVAWRDGRRFVAGLQRWQPQTSPLPALPVETGGFYAIAGGLGGVGELVAQYLLRAHGVRLLVMGRTQIDASASDPLTQQRAAAFRRLLAARSPSHLRYAAVDIRDAAAVRSAVRDASEAFGRPLDGAIHLAGTREEWQLSSRPAAALAEATAVWQEGARNLASVLEDRPGSLLALAVFSSGFLGGAGTGVYSSASRFAEALVAERRARGALRSFCLAFSPWASVGMSSNHPALAAVRSRGYIPINTNAGIDSLRLALSQHAPTLLVGLDPSARPVRARLGAGPWSIETPVAFYEAAPGTEPGSTSIDDRRGHPQPCLLQPVAQLPRDERGEVDRVRLRTSGAVSSGGGRFEPETEQAKQLASVWAEVLGAPPSSASETFFAAGGDSIRAVQFVSRLRDALGVELGLHQIFDEPAFAALAGTVARLGARAQRPIQRQSRDRFRARQVAVGTLDIPDPLREALRGKNARVPPSK